VAFIRGGHHPDAGERTGRPARGRPKVTPLGRVEVAAELPRGAESAVPVRRVKGSRDPPCSGSCRQRATLV